jgi:hypothetical protein
MFRFEDPAFTPVQQAVVDRLDQAVAFGMVAAALLVLLAAVRTVRALW